MKPLLRASWWPSVVLLTAGVAFGQSPLAPPRPIDNFGQYAQAVALPPSPYELIAGGITTLTDPADRGTALALLDHARTHFTLLSAQVPPFEMNVSFSAQGFAVNNGLGSMQQTWLAPQAQDWMAEIGGVRTDRYFYRGVFSNDPKAPVPLPVQMVREAMLWPAAYATSARLSLRQAAVSWNGAKATCVLVAGASAVEPPNSRGWDEAEYCVDAASGQLLMASQAPGLYEVYNYQGAINFHGHILPGSVQIVANGATVLAIKLDGLADAEGTDLMTLRPTAAMVQLGRSFQLSFPMDARTIRWGSAVKAPAMTVIEATINQQGQVNEALLVSSSGDPVWDQQALEGVQRRRYGRGVSQREFVFLSLEMPLQLRPQL